MALTAGTAYIDLRARTDTLDRDLKGAESKLTTVGKRLTSTLTPVAAGLAVAFKKSFDEWDAGIDSIRVSTGATGKALKGLETSMKNVAGKVTQPLSEVGKVMGDLAQRTELTGKPLERLTKQVLDLARITGTDAQTSVANLTRLFGDWSIKSKDMTGTMDRLFRASQATGIGMDQLSGLMVQFGSPLRNLGLDFDTSAAMFAKFEKEGVNIQTMMPGLRMALKNFAAAGREPSVALRETFEAMQNAKSQSELMTIAFETFGARAGPDMAAAVREGRFSLDELMGTMRNGSDTIAKATADTTDLSDKFAMMRNRIVATLGPFGEIGAIAFSAIAAIGPLIMGLGALSTALKGSAVASFIAGTAMKAIPFVLIATAVITLAVLIVKNWDKIKEITVKVFGAIGAFMSRTWTNIKNTVADIVGAMLAFLFRSFANFLEFFFKIAGGILSAAEKAFGWVPKIGDKIKDFRAEFDRTTKKILSDLRKQADGMQSWGEKAAGDILHVAGEWRNLRELMSGPIKAGVIHGVGKFAPGGGIGTGTPGGSSLVSIGRWLQASGFRVAGHPAFPPIGGHTAGSFHYSGRAIDVNWGPGGGSAGEFAALQGVAAKIGALFGGRILESLGPWNDAAHGGANMHWHLAMDRGGIVKGPATIHQGNITEAHIPLTGQGATGLKIAGILQTPFGPSMIQATVLGMLSDGRLVDDALNRRIGSF